MQMIHFRLAEKKSIDKPTRLSVTFVSLFIHDLCRRKDLECWRLLIFVLIVVEYIVVEYCCAQLLTPLLFHVCEVRLSIKA